jgi:hypothetical protein
MYTQAHVDVPHTDMHRSKMVQLHCGARSGSRREDE